METNRAGQCLQYAVCVLAHNEETVIAETVRSLLAQQLEPGARLDVYVFTNGCTDRTDEVVCKLAQQEERVHLVSLPEKGKVYAIRESIAHFRQLHAHGATFDRVFYIDADVTFPDPETLQKLSRSLDESPALYLVSSYPLADTDGVDTSWFLSWLIRGREELQLQFRHNIVRGRCYVIRYDALTRVEYPPETLSDDMYLEIRLDGHYRMDYSILTATKLKNSLDKEIRRDLFTLIAREQLYSWWNNQRIEMLDPNTRRREWSMHYPRPAELVRFLLRTGRVRLLAVMAIWAAIYRYNEYRARRIFRDSQRRQLNLLDYWSTQR